jgi:RNA polymerase sigma-70 factor (ECF subfamily)
MEWTPAQTALFLKHQTSLQALVRFYIHDIDLANETMSDVKIAIFEAWDGYQPEKPFINWAAAIARHVVFANKRRAIRLSQALPETLIFELTKDIDELGDRCDLELKREALACCMRRLQPHHNELLKLHYFQDISFAELARSINRPVPSLHTLFHRLRKLLEVCITRQMPRL